MTWARLTEQAPGKAEFLSFGEEAELCSACGR